MDSFVKLDTNSPVLDLLLDSTPMHSLIIIIISALTPSSECSVMINKCIGVVDSTGADCEYGPCNGNIQVHKQPTPPQRDTIVLSVSYLKEEV